MGGGEERINMLEPLEEVDEDGDKDKLSIDDVIGWVQDALERGTGDDGGDDFSLLVLLGLVDIKLLLDDDDGDAVVSLAIQSKG